ncbi:hypothetical protein GN244_ATG09384 [Phytophthora infestans]|uniref:Transmembrane protein n=1 Tax=Phytophthora infestans TaxID=4787 RepID=A0A833WJW8_PHYIN|nr:hypothetical protein GN244_ATG09384 [Phytophthora infestans]
MALLSLVLKILAGGVPVTGIVVAAGTENGGVLVAGTYIRRCAIVAGEIVTEVSGESVTDGLVIVALVIGSIITGKLSTGKLVTGATDAVAEVGGGRCDWRCGDSSVAGGDAVEVAVVVVGAGVVVGIAYDILLVARPFLRARRRTPAIWPFRSLVRLCATPAAPTVEIAAMIIRSLAVETRRIYSPRIFELETTVFISPKIASTAFCISTAVAAICVYRILAGCLQRCHCSVNEIET